MLIVRKTGQKWSETRLKMIANHKQQTRQSSERFKPRVLRCIGHCRQEQVVAQFKQVSQSIAFGFGSIWAVFNCVWNFFPIVFVWVHKRHVKHTCSQISFYEAETWHNCLFNVDKETHVKVSPHLWCELRFLKPHASTLVSGFHYEPRCSVAA